MARKAHKVGPYGGELTSDSVVCLQVGCRQEYGGDADEYGRMALAEWRACVGTHVNGKVTWEKWHRGSGRADFYDKLPLWAEGYKRCLIFTRNAREAAAALGLWDAVLCGTVSLTGLDPWSDGEDRKAGGTKYGGYVVLEGPPTVIAFRMADPLPCYVWLDPANFGMDNGLLRSLHKCELDIDPASWEPEPWLSPETIGEQAAAVRLWVESYLASLVRLDLGRVQHTAASQAAAGFRRHNREYPVWVHDNPAVLALEREALYGGRCECRHVGTVEGNQIGEGDAGRNGEDVPIRYTVGKVYHVDINSLYPAMAAVWDLPTRLETVCENVSMSAAVQAARKLATVARVRVATEVPCVPVRHGEGTIYPVGIFDTVLCGPEMLLAAKHGRILKVHTLAAYQKHPLYRSWVMRLYGERRRLVDEGLTGAAFCVKALLNASFGKWAQRSRRWVDVPGDLPPFPFYQWWQKDKATGEPVQYRSFAWQVQRLDDAGEPAESFPAITAYVCSLARVQLWEDMQAAGVGNVLYYDTDSLWLTQDGYARLSAAGRLSPVTLGAYKIVAEHDTVSFLGHKKYIADGRLTLAGACDPAFKVGDAFALQFKAPPMSHYLLHGDPPGMDRHAARVRITGEYKLGRVERDGSVTPHRLDTRQDD